MTGDDVAKTAVSIIPLELVEEVAEIISEELTSLTQENRDQLEVLRQTALTTTKVQDDKSAQNRVVKDAIQNLLRAAADRLLAAGEVGVPSAEIMRLVRPLITTTPAFTLRMKTYLRAGGNQHIIARVKDNYLLRPYNQEDENTTFAPLSFSEEQ